MSELEKLTKLLSSLDKIGDKSRVVSEVVNNFKLTQDRSVYYCDDFAIRFSSAKGKNFSNTVLSLSNLQKVDDRPFIVCLVTPDGNYCYMANSTFLKKISHSSQELRENNIKGSFNGSDIMKEFESEFEKIENIPKNFERLFAIHSGVGFDGNLVRLVEATTDITPTGKKFEASELAIHCIFDAPARAEAFVVSQDALELKRDLDDKVNRFRNEILLAALIENVNVRGRIIEYLVSGENEALRQEIIYSLKHKSVIPPFRTDNSLGDYSRSFDMFHTETDVKTKIMILDSNPKAYNLDKMLEFLSQQKSVFMFYFIGVDPCRIVNTVLVSMFQTRLLRSTLLLKHWAGRNSRGVSQFEGKAIEHLIHEPESDIDKAAADKFLRRVLSL